MAERETRFLPPTDSQDAAHMTLKEQEKNDSDLANWLLDRLLNPQDPFDQNVMVRWTESGRDRARELIFSTIKSARKNTARDLPKQEWKVEESDGQVRLINPAGRTLLHGELHNRAAFRDLLDNIHLSIQQATP